MSCWRRHTRRKHCHPGSDHQASICCSNIAVHGRIHSASHLAGCLTPSRLLSDTKRLSLVCRLFRIATLGRLNLCTMSPTLLTEHIFHRCLPDTFSGRQEVAWDPSEPGQPSREWLLLLWDLLGVRIHPLPSLVYTFAMQWHSSVGFRVGHSPFVQCTLSVYDFFLLQEGGPLQSIQLLSCLFCVDP